jgi:hypothetical protein
MSGASLSTVVGLLTFDMENNFPMGLSRLEKLRFLLLCGDWKLHGAQAAWRLTYTKNFEHKREKVY